MAEKDIGDRAIGRMEGDGTQSAGATEDMRREASRLGDQARASLEGSVDAARDTMAENVSRAGEALHAAADRLGREDTFGGLIEAAAGQLDSASTALRNRDMSHLMHDVTDFARRQPALFIGGAVAAGFALGRLASAGTRTGVSSRTGDSHSYASAGAQESRMGSAIGGVRDERQTSSGISSSGISSTGSSGSGPSTTTPGQQPPGARPQARGSSTGLTPDE